LERKSGFRVLGMKCDFVIFSTFSKVWDENHILLWFVEAKLELWE
jgi:hypothetical protein